MREPIVLLALCAGLLSACASPRAVGQGDLTPITGASVAAHGGHAGGAEDLYVRAIQQGVLEQLGASPTNGAPLFLVQVGVAQPLPGIGVSSAADALELQAWRSAPDDAPWWRFWARPEGKRAVTLAVIDAQNGKTIAWSSTRVGDEPPTAVAKRLLDALEGAGRP